jgi:hypothetical protein
MSLLELLPALVGYIMCGLAIIHALFDARENRVQRFLMIMALFLGIMYTARSLLCF